MVGDSAGGHLAACLVTIDMPGIRKDEHNIDSMANAAICYNPCIDMNVPLIKSIFGFDDESWGGDNSAPSSNSAVIRTNYKISPLAHVKPGSPPMLIIHGDADTIVPVEQSHSMEKAMKKAGNRCDLIVLKGVNHAFAIVGYGTEETIVCSLMEADRFLASLGFLAGKPTIALSSRGE